MDPFEARLYFSSTLERLNNSYDATPSAAISFLLANVDLEEDLYSCILEELDKPSGCSHKLGIFYFLESLFYDTSPVDRPDNNSIKNHYHEWILRDLQRIIEKVIPSVEEMDKVKVSSHSRRKSRPESEEEKQRSNAITILVNIQPVREIIKGFLDKKYLSNEKFQQISDWLTKREEEL